MHCGNKHAPRLCRLTQIRHGSSQAKLAARPAQPKPSPTPNPWNLEKPSGSSTKWDAIPTSSGPKSANKWDNWATPSASTSRSQRFEPLPPSSVQRPLGSSPTKGHRTRDLDKKAQNRPASPLPNDTFLDPPASKQSTSKDVGHGKENTTGTRSSQSTSPFAWPDALGFTRPPDHTPRNQDVNLARVQKSFKPHQGRDQDLLDDLTGMRKQQPTRANTSSQFPAAEPQSTVAKSQSDPAQILAEEADLVLPPSEVYEHHDPIDESSNTMSEEDGGDTHMKKDKLRESRSFSRIMNNSPGHIVPTRAALEHQKPAPKLPVAAKVTAVVRNMYIPSVVTVELLAKLLGLRLNRLQRHMTQAGLESTAYDYVLSGDIAAVLAEDFGFNAIIDDEAAFDLYPPPKHPHPETLPLRPPVVTIMGHVDHGKTTLLDFLRTSSVAKGEAGGITQHIGAFSVPVKSSSSSVKTITFLDTPGHAAFTAMRARGASVTDIIVLVVAADDGVMPQTREVLEIIKKDQTGGNNLGVVVAINKVDKPEADIDYVQKELMGEGLDVEGLGGNVPSVNVSGLTGAGLPELVETLSALAEMQDLRAERDNSVPVVGYIIEARQKKGLGHVATVLVLRGCLKTGDHILAGTASAKVKAMVDSAQKGVKVAYPGDAVTVAGWKVLPVAGDEVLSGSDSHIRKAISNREKLKSFKDMAESAQALNQKRLKEKEERIEYIALKAEAGEKQISPERLAKQIALGQHAEAEEESTKTLNLVIKADVNGSEEAVVESLQAIGNQRVHVKVLHSGVGDVTQSDFDMAKISKGVIVAFSVNIPRQIQGFAEQDNIPIVSSPIIYRLIEDIQERATALLPPIVETSVTAEVAVMQLFDIKLKAKKILKIAGCKVTYGNVTKSDSVWVIRNGETIFDGALDTLRIHKDNVNEVRKGQECGLSVADFEDIHPGDLLKFYQRIEKPGIL